MNATPTSKPESIFVGPLLVAPYKEPIRSHPNWMWRIKVRGSGGAVLRCGRWTPDEAQAIAAELLADGAHIEAGADPVVVKTVQHVLQAWEAQYGPDSPHAPNTRRCVRYTVLRLKSHLGTIRVEDVNHQTLHDYVRARRRGKDKGAWSTIKLELDHFRSAWFYARKQGTLPSRCVADPDRPRLHHLAKEPTYNRFTPSPEAALAVGRALLERAEESPWARAWAGRAVIVGYHIGARVSELGPLRWEDVDLKRRTIIIRKGKTGRRTVPITEEFLQELTAWKGLTPRDPFVLAHAGRWAASRGRELIKETCRQLNQPEWSWHGLRRLCVRRLSRAGVPVRTAAEWMGHSPGVMLRLYDACTEDDLHAAAARLDKAQRDNAEPVTIDELLGGVP